MTTPAISEFNIKQMVDEAILNTKFHTPEEIEERRNKIKTISSEIHDIFSNMKESPALILRKKYPPQIYYQTLMRYRNLNKNKKYLTLLHITDRNRWIKIAKDSGYKIGFMNHFMVATHNDFDEDGIWHNNIGWIQPRYDYIPPPEPLPDHTRKLLRREYWQCLITEWLKVEDNITVKIAQHSNYYRGQSCMSVMNGSDITLTKDCITPDFKIDRDFETYISAYHWNNERISFDIAKTYVTLPPKIEICLEDIFLIKRNGANFSVPSEFAEILN